MKRAGMFLLLCLTLGVGACGGSEAAPAANTATANEPAAIGPTAEPLIEGEEEATAVAAIATALSVNETGGVTLPCEDYFRYCVTASTSGEVNAAVTTGTGGNIESCAGWSAVGEPRILELPFIVAAGDDRVTVALTRIAAYTGPGTYELQAVVTEGIPDMFPAIEAAGRVFSNGEGSAATVTVAADGSGSITATGLVEQESIQVSSPDPTARVDFEMEWTCRDI